MWHHAKQQTRLSSVHSLSSTSNPALVETRHRAVAGVQDVVMKPQPIADYNKLMGGVDLADQLRQVHTIHQKHRKWWKYLCFYLLDVSIVNAYIVYKATPGVKSRTFSSTPSLCIS